jgi:hypothetical protein
VNNLILSYSDIHFRDVGSFPPFNQLDSNGLTRELNNILTGVDFICECLYKYKPKILVGLGDTVQVTEFQTCQTLHGIYLAYRKLRATCKDTGTEHWYFDGNHDILNENKGISNTGLIEAWVDRFIKEPEIIERFGYKFGCIPYSSNVGTVYELLTQYQDNCLVGLTHQNFKDCMYESGQRSDSYLPNQYNFPILSGDIHLPQEIGSVHYGGSLIQNKFNKSDLNQIGGCLLFSVDELNNRKVIRLPNTKSKHYVRIYDKDLCDDEKMMLLPKERVCLQVISSWNKEKISERLSGYEYFIIPEFKQDESNKVTYSNYNIIEPLDLLRNHIQEENPNNLLILNDILKDKNESITSN